MFILYKYKTNCVSFSVLFYQSYIMSLSTLLINIFLVLFIVLGFFHYKFSYWKFRGFVTTRPRNPLGDFYDVGFRYHFVEKFGVLYQKFKTKAKIIGTYISVAPSLILIDLDLIRIILVKDFHYFQDRGVYYNERDDPLTAHLFAIEGEKWRRLRNSLSPTFTSGRMKQMFFTISDKGGDLIKYIENNHVKTQSSLSTKDISQRFTAEAIGSCVFGLDVHALKSTDVPDILHMAKETFDSTPLTALYLFFISTYRSIARSLRCRVFKKSVPDFFIPLLGNTVKYREDNKIFRNDFLNMVMNLKNRGTIFDDRPIDIGGKINFIEMCAQSFIFFFAGFETSSTAMAFALYFLAKYPEVQDKVRDEIKRVKQVHNNEISYDALMEMTYLNQVFNETLRLFPPVGSLIRKALVDYKIPDTDLIIPKGTLITIPVYGIQRDPDIYPDPDKFDPNRFAPETMQKRHPYSFLPFGEGPRNCIGMRFGQIQSKYGMATIVDNFEIRVNKKTQEPLKIDLSTPNMGAKGGIWLDVTKL